MHDNMHKCYEVILWNLRGALIFYCSGTDTNAFLKMQAIKIYLCVCVCNNNKRWVSLTLYTIV